MREMDKDLRIIRTKELIREALITLIEENGFMSITVKDITTKARINRGTFYSHYQDKFDLMAHCREEILSQLECNLKHNIEYVNTEQEITISSNAPFSIFFSFFEYLKKNRRYIRAIYQADLSFHTHLKEFIWNLLFVRKELAAIKQENLLVPSEYLIAYLASAHMGVIQQWLDGDGQESAEEMARILYTMTVKGPFTAAGLHYEQV